MRETLFPEEHMRNLYTTGEVVPWEAVGILIEVHGGDGVPSKTVRVIVTPERAEALARKLLALAAQFQPDSNATEGLGDDDGDG